MQSHSASRCTSHPMQAVADEHVRVPSDELPAETRVEVFALGRGTYARVERRLMRADRHWLRFDGAGGAELALTAATGAAGWKVLASGQALTVAVPSSGSEPFAVTLVPGLTVLDLYEEAGRRAGGVPAQCVQLAFLHTHELLPSLDTVQAAARPVFAAGVQEGSELVLSMMQQAEEGSKAWALGLPAKLSAGSRAVARWRRERLGLAADASDAAVAEAAMQAQLDDDEIHRRRVCLRWNNNSEVESEEEEPLGDQEWAKTNEANFSTGVDELFADLLVMKAQFEAETPEYLRHGDESEEEDPLRQKDLLADIEAMPYGARLAEMEKVFVLDKCRQLRSRDDPLEFTKVAIKKPLCRMDNFDGDKRIMLEKKAVATFSSILGYLGETYHQYPELLASQILQDGIDNPELVGAQIREVSTIANMHVW